MEKDLLFLMLMAYEEVERLRNASIDARANLQRLFGQLSPDSRRRIIEVEMAHQDLPDPHVRALFERMILE